MTDEIIGIVGVGAMGAPIAHRIEAAGFRLALFDVSAAALRPFAAGKAVLPGSAKAVADVASSVLVCVPDNAACREAVLGSDGVIAGGAVRRYVHLGTSGPELVRELEIELRSKGVETLDAPVTGGAPRARTGQLTSIVAGPPALVEELKPLLSAYSAAVKVVGETVGAAQLAKLVNNILSVANLAIACEALEFGRKAGLDPRGLIDAVNAGSGMSNASAVKIPNHVLSGTFDYGGRLAIARKDSAQYLAETEKLGASNGLARGIAEFYRTVADELGADADITEIVRYFARPR